MISPLVSIPPSVEVMASRMMVDVEKLLHHDTDEEPGQWQFKNQLEGICLKHLPTTIDGVDSDSGDWHGGIIAGSESGVVNPCDRQPMTASE